MPTDEKTKVKVRKHTEVFTVMYSGKSNQELMKMGNIYEHEMDKLYVSPVPDYDENHMYIDIDGANFIIRKEDLL